MLEKVAGYKSINDGQAIYVPLKEVKRTSVKEGTDELVIFQGPRIVATARYNRRFQSWTVNEFQNNGRFLHNALSINYY